LVVAAAGREQRSEPGRSHDESRRDRSPESHPVGQRDGDREVATTQESLRTGGFPFRIQKRTYLPMVPGLVTNTWSTVPARM